LCGGGGGGGSLALGDHVAIVTPDSTFFILKYSAEAAAEALESGQPQEEDGAASAPSRTRVALPPILI
jgi:hypothetical protein